MSIFYILLGSILLMHTSTHAFENKSNEGISTLYTETDDCYISFIEYFGKKYVVKQIKDPSPSEQFLLVLDTLGCHIAASVKIPQNYVIIIPPGKFPGKVIVEFPATLHTLAHGVSTDQDCLYQDIDIHQRYRKENSPLWEIWGPLAPENTGLTYTVIKNMARHSDLPRITALDTFVGNADRSPPNLFFDSMTHHFTGIDMAASFCSPLAKEALRQLRDLEEKGIVFTAKEIKALGLYATTLNQLLETWTLEKLESKFRECIKMGRFSEENELYDESVANRIDFHLNFIKQNYEDCQELSSLLQRFL